MDTIEAIYSRRAVKHYDPEHKLSDDEFNKLMEAAIQAPTSFNIQQWRFVIVDDPAVRQQVREAANDQAQITEASLLLILTADVKAWEKSPARYWKDAPQEVADILVNWMGPFYEGKDRLQRDEAMRSCGIVGQTIMLAAKSMGYDSCPMIGFDQEKVAEIINLPEDHAIGFIIVVGKGIKPAWPKPGQLPLEEVIVKNSFN